MNDKKDTYWTSPDFFLGFIQILKNSSQGLERNHTLTLPINVAKIGLRFA